MAAAPPTSARAGPSLPPICGCSTPDGGLAAVAYAPSEVTTTVQGQHGTVRLETEYPFERYTALHGTHGRRHGGVPATTAHSLCGLMMRTSTLVAMTSTCQPGRFHRIERTWQDGDTVVLTLPMRPRIHTRPHQTVAITHGPLLYALKMGEEWRRINEDEPYRELPHGDWEVYATTPWNYALAIDRAHPEQSLTFERRTMPGLPFTPESTPIAAHVHGRRVPEWQEANNSAAQWPGGPASSTESLEELTLIPYGCTNLRMAEFPVLGEA